MDTNIRKALRAKLNKHLADWLDYPLMVDDEDMSNIILINKLLATDSLDRIATQLEDGTMSVINPNHD